MKSQSLTSDIESFTSIYFVGIGGIGMSALARWGKAAGKAVAGYDLTQTALTQKLEAEGIEIHYEENTEKIPDAFRSSQNTLVVFTPAVPHEHSELIFFRETGFEVVKRSELLGKISRAFKTVAVAGTHGKTTTSSMITALFYHNEKDAAAFLGGISSDLNSNLLLSKEISPEVPAVVEADEFDRSFHRLKPFLAVITSTDADHLDIYGEHEGLLDSFCEFVDKIHPEGMLFVCKKIDSRVLKHAQKSLKNVFTYSFETESSISKADFAAFNLRPDGERGAFIFDCRTPSGEIHDLVLHQPGFHNAENALAALAAAQSLGFENDEIRKGIASYKGVKRRFEYKIKHRDLIYIDDYAHHPTEIRSLLDSVRALYPGRKISVIFQPHLYSRTLDFSAGFAQSLDLADEIILADIYPAREKPIPGVDSGIIFDLLKKQEKYWLKDHELLNFVLGRKFDVLLTVGAGNIDRFVEPISKGLQDRLHSH